MWKSGTTTRMFLVVTAPNDVRPFFEAQAKRRLEHEFWAYDSISISSYSETLKQVQFGKNKESDHLPQINLLLLFGEHSGLPFYYRKLAGNVPDVKTVNTLLKELDAFCEPGRTPIVGEILTKQTEIYKGLNVQPPR